MKARLTSAQAKSLIQKYEEADDVYRHDGSFCGVTVQNVKVDTDVDDVDEIVWYYSAKVIRAGEAPEVYTGCNIEESELIRFSESLAI